MFHYRGEVSYEGPLIDGLAKKSIGLYHLWNSISLGDQPVIPDNLHLKSIYIITHIKYYKCKSISKVTLFSGF